MLSMGQSDATHVGTIVRVPIATASSACFRQLLKRTPRPLEETCEILAARFTISAAQSMLVPMPNTSPS